jgi:hypothetical protein
MVAAFALSLVAVISKYDIPAGKDDLEYELAAFIQDQSILIIIVANVVLLTSHILKSYFGNPWAWDTVKVLLEEFRSDVFRGENNLSAHLDRVTLFKKRDCRWRFGIIPSADWLCAVERSGHMTRRKRKWFRAKDDGQFLEGVAGATWGESQTIHKDGLPHLVKGAQYIEIETYAKETFVNGSYVRKQLAKGAPIPRSLCGIIVEVNSKPWGVIVIDSSLERLARKEDIEKFYQKNAKVLGKLLGVL